MLTDTCERNEGIRTLSSENLYKDDDSGRRPY